MRLRSRGTDPEVKRFSAALRRGDEEAFAAFVADLWGARGRPTTRDGTVLSVEFPDEERRLRVTHGAPTSAGDGRTRGVVTSRIVRESAARETESAASERPTVDAAELLRVVRYAVERDRAASILERHLGEGAAKFVEPGAVRAERERSRARRRRLGRRLVAAAVVAACLGGVALVGPDLASSLNAPPFDAAEETSAPSDRPTETAAAVRDESPASSSAERLDYAAFGCPSPPDDANPTELAPAVVPGASASGLDGWRLVDSESVGSFDDRIQLGSPPEPTERHTARYVPPSGETLRVTIDRWRSVGTADAVSSSLADANETVVRWGRYTVVVRAFDANGTRLSETQTLDRSRVLLAAVRGPDGGRLGFRCVSSLLDEADGPNETVGSDGESGPPTASADTA
ncbi:hypothetical protein C474_15574 [Halogeometricum pallidum JCM 14848]|uniref:Uncharacterized protein n=1 Tax=Halogeometricum pallidum JCM 14848 TaxID=1227487 RepID=M0D1B0_HALPD|nr:hypothetical protein [Halogeometricum pallidum]ELZ27934.1 hypothetical protein C474_15574 [Halogeometricum pallidum JCM 14848]